VKYPLDTPIWLERAFESVRESLQDDMAKAKSSDDALRASGAFGLWKRIEDELTFEADKQRNELLRQNEALNARGNPGSDA